MIDIGGGDSRLVDELVARHFACLTVLDVSATALRRAKSRLSSEHRGVRWLEADVTGDWNIEPVDIWHDRAAFHFLTDKTDRHQYVRHLREAVKHGGHVIIATFAPDGPPTCSGLPVRRYSANALALELGSGFELRETVEEEHRTPAGVVQPFCFTRFRRVS
jgi:trans-aconitate methyltransferase